jgi:GNAT superfamily N-acetyltransferase
MAAVETIVRTADGEDRASLFSLTSQFPTPTPCPFESFSALLDSKLGDSSACILVAEHQGALIGYVSGSVRTAFYAAGATAWVEEILVRPEFRGRGVGAELMRAFESWAEAHGSRLVALATRGAVAFYERLGYATSAAYLKKYLAPPPERA